MKNNKPFRRTSMLWLTCTNTWTTSISMRPVFWKKRNRDRCSAIRSSALSEKCFSDGSSAIDIITSSATSQVRLVQVNMAMTFFDRNILHNLKRKTFIYLYIFFYASPIAKRYTNRSHPNPNHRVFFFFFFLRNILGQFTYQNTYFHHKKKTFIECIEISYSRVGYVKFESNNGPRDFAPPPESGIDLYLST